MKIIINTCYGGYGLSKEAILRYAKLKGMTLYTEDSLSVTHYYTVPVEEYHAISAEAKIRREYTKVNGVYFHDRDIERTDPILVQVVEELGKNANGTYSDLQIIDIPDNVKYFIDDYDGRETVREEHRSWS